jgi:hypothetical protein
MHRLLLTLIFFCLSDAKQLALNEDAIKITGLTYDNKIFNLNVKSGKISIIGDNLIQDTATTFGISCAKANQLFSFLSRTKNAVKLLTFDIFANTSFSNVLPFYPQTSSREFLLGLDFYMDSTNSQRNISIVGPDEIQFIHMIEAELKLNKKLAYIDILQYSGGLRLERGQSTFDTKQNQQWLQVVYDVSNNVTTTSNVINPKMYLKRYDIKKSSVIDIIPDIGNSAIVEFDKGTSTVYTIGWCVKKQKRCLFKLDNTTRSASSAPVLTQLFELPQYYGIIMSGVSRIDSYNSILYFVSSKSFNRMPQTLVPSTLVTCNSGGICKRYGDATYETFTGHTNITDEFVIVGINFKTGHITSENPLHWNDGKHVMVQQGKVIFLKCGK